MKMAQTDTLISPVQDSATTVASLAELGPLYEPPPVPFTFEAIGWSVLAGMLFIALSVLAYFLIRQYRRNRYRREALAELEKLPLNTEQLPGILSLLKRTAIQAFGRESVADLYGKAWLGFLEKTGKNIDLLRYEQELSDALYKEKPLSDDVYRSVRSQAMKWIQTHAREF